mmetsp:Transcript_27493/g.63574  ORF Transcript_27493/g.63574 Transcript_27493/m.63574 type:complete len:147 (-) Transcript_27493:97-537(-)
MRSLSAAISGAVAMHLLANFFTAPLALAAWCWAATGYTGSVYGCVNEASIGVGACGVAEECCDGYTCFIVGQCVGGAPVQDDVDGPNGHNTRTLGLAGSDVCNATTTTITTTTGNTTTGDVAVASACQCWPHLVAVVCAVFTVFQL